MAAEDGERVGLKRKLTGPPRFLLGRTRTRRTGKDRMVAKQTGNDGETLTSAPAGSEDVLTCRRHQNAAGMRMIGRWWSRFSSAVVCIRSKGKDDGSTISPPEGALQKHEGSRRTDLRKMRNILRRFVASPDVQQRPDPSKEKKPSPSSQTRLQKFFIRLGRSRSDQFGNMEEDQRASRLTELPDGHPEVQMFLQDLSEEPEPPAEAPEDGPEEIQTAPLNQVLVRDVSSEEDEVLFDSELVVDLHDQPPFLLASEEKMVQMFPPPTNGPSIRIELYPPDDVPEEEEEQEEEHWLTASSTGNLLLHLLCLDSGERRLLQTARSLVRTAVAAAVDQLTREQQNNVDSAHQEPQGCR